MSGLPPFLRSHLFTVLVFLAGTTLLGAALAPWIYLGGKHVVAVGWLEGGWLGGLHDSMDRGRFSRYFNRSLLLAGALLLWPALKLAGRNRRSGESPAPASGESRTDTARAALGLEPNPQWARQLLSGFGLAAAPLLLLGWTYVALGWYDAVPPARSVAAILLSALGTGIAVALLEETVFRGALHALAARLLRPRALLLSVAAFFAALHFCNPPHGLEAEKIDAATGFWMVGQIVSHVAAQFARPSFLLAEFAVLFAIGLVLGYARMKTASLWLGIGLHAGWVFGVKTLSPLSVRAFAADAMMPWLGDTLRVGAVSCLVVLFTGFLVWLVLRGERRDPFAEAP